MKRSNKKPLSAIYSVVGTMVALLVVWWGFSLYKTNTDQYKPLGELVSYVEYPHTIPVMTIDTEPDNLWDDEIGIYVQGNHDNVFQTGEDWERPAKVRYYQPVGNDRYEIGFYKNIGLRLHGHALRTMPQKAFRIYFKNDYGNNSKLEYPLFDNDRSEVFTTLVLRSGESTNSMIRDQVANQLVTQAGNVDVLRGKPVAVYLNKKYWGLYYLTERFDDNYFKQRYDVDEKSLGLLSAELDGKFKGHLIADDRRSEEDAVLFNEMIENNKRCVGCLPLFLAKEQIDVENMIDYYIFEMFFSNADWPNNNLKAWRYKSEENFPEESKLIPELDGRFRWLLFDFDAGMGAGNHTTEAMIESAKGNPYGFLIDNDFPLRNLFYDNDFARQYQDRSDQLLQTVLSPQNTTNVVDEIARQIEDEMSYQVVRWGGLNSYDGQVMLESVETWKNEVELLKTYLQSRNQFFEDNTQAAFENKPT